MFLLFGGAIRRKGIDVLLQAYSEPSNRGKRSPGRMQRFQPGVCAQLHAAKLQEFMNDAGPSPPVSGRTAGRRSLANLYRGCDAFVLPYRGEDLNAGGEAMMRQAVSW